jgi:DNA-binding FrmR family transcriptional regulator
MKENSDKQLIQQLHRIKGQIDGVERMIGECKSCDAVVMQLMAARSSLEQVTLKLLSEETDSCVKSNNKKDLEKIKKIASTLFKYT